MKKILNNKYLPFIILLVLMLFLHLFMDFIGDDIWFAKQLSHHSLFDFLASRYTNWSSRLIIETILVSITKININIWRILDCIFYVLACFLILKLVNVKDKKIINYLGCLLFLTYPFFEMSGAGWAATTLNYLWPLSLGLLSFLPLINYENKKKNNKFIYIISFISLLYSTNQEQSCALIFGFNFLYFIYKIYKKEKINKYNVICLVFSLASLIFILTCPGNGIRSIEETEKWYPEFENFNIIDKIYLGLVPTINLLLENKIIILYTIVILSIASYIYSKKEVTKYISVFNIIIILLLTIFKTPLLDVFPYLENLFNHFAYQGLPIITSKLSLLTIMFSLLLIADIIYMLLVIFKNKQLLPLFVFLAGFASRFIIGFSPTVFVSGNRTALFLYMCLITVILFTLVKLYNDKKINKRYEKVLVVAFLVFAIFNYINTFIYI